MPKVIFIADNHFCINSSVVNKRGEYFSDRLENQISSIKWVDSFGLPVFHAGDFFDKPILTSEERSALDQVKDIVSKWTFLLGNHEYSGGFDQLGSLNGRYIRIPTEVDLYGLKTLFLPFNSTEGDIKGRYDLIVGHLGLKDIPFGAKGLDFNIIDKSCEIFLNGHLHNRLKLGENKWNIGSLTSQNFSDDCLEYRKGIVILDTDTKTLEFIENPYAFNFFKFKWGDFSKFTEEQKNSIVKETSCLSISCLSGEKQEIMKSGIFDKVYYLRVSEELSSKKQVEVNEKPIIEFDHLAKFRGAFISKVGESSVVLEELSEVLNG